MKASEGPPPVVIKGPSYSDGDASHRPDASKERRAWEGGYLQLLATTWMKDEGGAQPGKKYVLDRLPAGYEAWERPRPSDPTHIDRWLYGHPSHKKFDSPNRFLPHFKFLMKHASGDVCMCDLLPSSAAQIVSLYAPAQVPPSAEGGHEPQSLSFTGYRIEPLPSVNSSDKNLSKQHSYVPLHLIRPFCFWKFFLQGVAESEWHVSIHNALTASATVSLVDRQRFQGRWPDAAIHSRGLYVGAECYWIGDTVRLLFKTSSPSTEISAAIDKTSVVVMRIQRIITTFYNLTPEPSNPQLVTGNRCDQITITVQGPVYVSNLSASMSQLRPASAKDLSDPMKTFNTQWYPISPHPNDIHSASFSNIHSRLYEFSACESYFPALPYSALLHLDSTGEATTRARAIAAATDERIVRDGGSHKRWFWAGCRAEGLGLQRVNGVEVGAYDGEREPRVWRQVLGVVDGRSGGGEREEGGHRAIEDEENEEEEKSGEGGGGRRSSTSLGEGRKESGREGGNGEEDDDDDDVIEIEAPEKKRARIEVAVPPVKM
ncbi:MAG: hypothetical protein L6R40_006583 [Gallowayella cf. fulva]|nr:MAG: hypothetical protein L6R40_006583 [Xanthomendoza cf. fulva]